MQNIRSQRRAKYRKQKAGRLSFSCVLKYEELGLAGGLARAQLSMCCVSGKFSLEESKAVCIFLTFPSRKCEEQNYVTLIFRVGSWELGVGSLVRGARMTTVNSSTLTAMREFLRSIEYRI